MQKEIIIHSMKSGQYYFVMWFDDVLENIAKNNFWRLAQASFSGITWKYLWHNEYVTVHKAVYIGFKTNSYKIFSAFYRFSRIWYSCRKENSKYSYSYCQINYNRVDLLTKWNSKVHTYKKTKPSPVSYHFTFTTFLFIVMASPYLATAIWKKYLLLNVTVQNVHSNKITLKTTILLTHTYVRQFYGHDNFDAQFDTLGEEIMQHIEANHKMQS